MVIKAYRADWDGTLQPYALYVPRDYKPGRAGGLAADRRAARRVLRPPPQPAARVRPGQPPRRKRRRGVTQRADAARPGGAGRVAVRARRAHGLRRAGGRRRDARARGRAARLRHRPGSHQHHGAVDGRRRRLAAGPAPPRAVRGDRARVRGRRPDALDPAAGRRLLRHRGAGGGVAAGAGRQGGRARGVHLSRRQGHDRAGGAVAADGRALPGARLAGQERPLHRIPERRSRRLGARLQGRGAAADAGRHQTQQGRAQRPPSPPAPGVSSRGCSARASRASSRTSTSTTARARRSVVAAARALATALADWGPMVGARFT